MDLSLTNAGGEGLEAWTGGGGEKIFLLNNNILAGVAGITSDANSLVNYARNAAQKHLFTYDEEIPVEMLAQRLCDLKQGYTQYGGESLLRGGTSALQPFDPSSFAGLRPFGVSLLYIGHDPIHGFQLYHSDPSGNYSGWKATCIGANSSRLVGRKVRDLGDDTDIRDASCSSQRTIAAQARLQGRYHA